MDPAQQAYFYNNFQDPLNKSVHTPVNNGLQGCPASSATGTTRQNLHHTLHFPSPGSSTPSSDHISTGPNDWSGDYMEQLNSNWQHQQVQHTGNTGIGSYPQLQQHHQRFGIADCLEWRSLAEKDEPAGVAAASGFPAAGGANTGMMMTANSGSPSPAASAAAEGAVLVPRSPDEGSGQLGDAPSRSELSGEGQQASAGVDDGAGTSMGKLHLPLINLKVCCGDMVGVLLVAKGKIALNFGQINEKEVSPTEFERLGGRSATKKWKQSIRLIDDNGEPGRPVGEWYVMQGLEQPKKPREAKEWGEAVTSLGGLGAGSSSRHGGDMHGLAMGAAKAEDKLLTRRPVRASARHAVAAAAAAAAAAGSPPDSPEPAEGPAWQQQQQQQRGKRNVAAHYEDQGSATIQPTAALSSQQEVVSNWASGPGAAAAVGGGEFQQQQAAAAALSATLAMDAAALGQVECPAGPAAAPDWQPPPPGGSAPGSNNSRPVLLPVPVASALPGDASQAVVEMTAYLEGKRSMPPWRLLPQHQRPLLGRLLVPLRQLFIMVMQAGGYVRIKDELLAWQGMASQLGLPAWPCPEVPDPLRVLQQVYRDYLLRFEGRFALAQQPPQHNSPGATSSMTVQYGFSTCSAALAGPAGGGSSVQLRPSFSPATSAVGSADHHHHGMAAANPSGSQDHMQHLQHLNSVLPSAAGATDLDDLMSGDLVSILTDLIPEDELDMALMPPPPVVGGGSPALLAGAAQRGTAPSDSVVAAAVRTQLSNRQHPEMANVAQRQRRQQLLQQLQAHAQDLGVQPHTQGNEPLVGSTMRSKRPAPLVRCGDSDVINLLDQSEVSQLLRDHELHQQQQQASGQRRRQDGAQQQRPAGAPVDRTISVELQRLLAGYGGGHHQQRMQHEQHLQPLPEAHQQLVPEGGGQQGDGQQELQAQAPEEEMSGMLEALQLEQQQPLASHLELPGSAGDDLSAAESLVSADDEEEHQQRQQQRLPVENISRDCWPQQVLMSSGNALLMQKSMGAHLVDMLDGSANNSSGSIAEGAQVLLSDPGTQDMSITLPTLGQQPATKPMLPLQQQAAAGGCTGASADDDMQTSQQLPPRTVLSSSQQQQQQQCSMTAAARSTAGAYPSELPGPPAADQMTDLPAFRGGLLRLTTPNSLLIGSVLDSPSGRGGPSASGWMDLPMPGHNLGHMLSVDLHSMAAELAGLPVGAEPAGAEGGGTAAGSSSKATGPADPLRPTEATGPADPLSSVLKMW